MAMLRLGMGMTPPGAGVTTTPDKAVRFMDGAKVWLSPSTIGAEFAALTAAAKTDLMGTLTSPRALGFLLVPAAAILALALWSGAAKRRREKNPRRRLAVRRQNPRRRVARGRRRNPNYTAYTKRTAHRTYYLMMAVDSAGSTVGSDSLMTEFPEEARERAQGLANRAAMAGHHGVRVRVYPRGGTRSSTTIRPNPKRRRNAARPVKRRKNGRSTTPKYVLQMPGMTDSAWSGRLPTESQLERRVMEYVVSTMPGFANEHIGRAHGISIPSYARVRVNKPNGPVMAEWRAPSFMVLPDPRDYPRVARRNPKRRRR